MNIWDQWPHEGSRIGSVSVLKILIHVCTTKNCLIKERREPFFYHKRKSRFPFLFYARLLVMPRSENFCSLAKINIFR